MGEFLIGRDMIDQKLCKLRQISSNCTVMTSVPTMPDDRFERQVRASGARHIAGVDEVGRGPLAGPVVAAAVILDPDFIPQGLDDSKRLSPKGRERLFGEISSKSLISIASAPPSLITSLNIRGATLWAMRQAVRNLPVLPDHVLIDGRDVPDPFPCPAQALIGGDRLSVSIAAASIIAKVIRDRMCTTMHTEEPHFDFAGHKGYPTPAHLEALLAHGPGRHHRLDFAPVRAAAKRWEGLKNSF